MKKEVRILHTGGGGLFPKGPLRIWGGDPASSGEQGSSTAAPGVLPPQAAGHRVSTLQTAGVR